MSQQNSQLASLSANCCGCLVRFIFFGIFLISVFLIRSILDSPDPQNQVRKVKQSEAKQYVNSMNKGQQAYFAEKSVFRTSVEALGLGFRMRQQITNIHFEPQSKLLLIMDSPSNHNLRVMSAVSL